MKFITTIVAAFSVLLLASCSKSESRPAEASVTYPTDAETVTASSSPYMQVFKSDQTGISYYARRLPIEDSSKMPEGSVIKNGTNAVLVVPIKDGKVVPADSSEHAELENRIPQGMLK
jgi:hypothetical protein